MMKTQTTDTVKLLKQLEEKTSEIIALREEKIAVEEENRMLRKSKAVEDSIWASEEGLNRHYSGKDSLMLHIKETIHATLNDPKLLHRATMFDSDQFAYIYEKFEAKIGHTDDAPLFAEDMWENAGNRCLLSKREVLLMSLVRKRGNVFQDLLAVFFGVDQATVSRYLAFADPILETVLPTAKNITEKIKKARTVAEFEELVPGSTVIPDGTEVTRQRPLKKDARKRTYSGKKKQFTFNTTIVSNTDGLIIGIGRTFEGAANDMTMIRDDPIDLGRWSKSMKSGRGNQITVLADKGYIGLDKYCPGIKLKIPTKKPKFGELTESQKARNKRISSKRIVVEHAIGRMKQFKLMRGPYDGTMQDFECELNVITGLANFKLLWDKRRRRLKHGF